MFIRNIVYIALFFTTCHIRALEDGMEDYEFVDIERVCPAIKLDIIYATNNNFTRQVLYPVAKCYLRQKVAYKLAKVQAELEKLGLGLKIFDGYRPFRVTQKFWDLIGDTRYVADPKVGSKHNRGAAVDVTLIDFDGRELEMPTAIDEMTQRAHRDYDHLPEQVIAHRKLLEDVMISGGFLPFPSEWWHFDDSEWERYPIEDICITELLQRDNEYVH
jgi:D-alanyl-D-alanine dipeptidase